MVVVLAGRQAEKVELHLCCDCDSRVRPEGGFKNRNRIPDLTRDNSGSCYQNRNIYFLFPVPVNPEPEFQFLVPAQPEPEIGFHRISGRNLPEFIFRYAF